MDEPIPDYWSDVAAYRSGIERGIHQPYSALEILQMPAEWVTKLFQYMTIRDEAIMAKRELSG